MSEAKPVEWNRARRVELHRRCQSAESGLARALEGAGGPSLGRALANSAATMYRGQLDDLRRDILTCAALAPGCKNWNQIVEECREAMERKK